MRSILPILALLAAFVFSATLAQSDEAPSSHAGNQLVAEAVQALIQQPALEAKVRQRATLFGQRVSGAGFYLQLREDDQFMLRYEFKLQVADQLTSLLQVNDGTTLWLRQDRGKLQSQAYVNVRRLREAKQQLQADPTAPMELEPDLALGGLSEVLRKIENNFQFSDPKPSELLGLPTWEVTGAWKQDRLAQIAPGAVGKKDGIGNPNDFPMHLPDVVKLVLGRDAKFPLFPYRILFGRTQRSESIASITGNNQPWIEPIVTIELYDVHRRPELTAADFDFQPSDENVEDRTEQYLKKLGLVKDEG